MGRTVIGVAIPFNETRWVCDRDGIVIGGKMVFGNWISPEMHEWMDKQIGPGTRLLGQGVITADRLRGVTWGYQPPRKTMWFRNPRKAMLFKLAWGGEQ
jgi:hypothetical protein